MVSSLSIENLSGVSLGGELQNRVERSSIQKSDGVVGANFSDLLQGTIEQVNAAQKDADAAIKNLVAGRTKNIHETMLTLERADMSLKLMMQVRNKILEAYREVMRMQV
jgi:flagellar hook-basal body complex protein FliE